MTPPDRSGVPRWERMLVILVGVVLGYVGGRAMDDRPGWENVVFLTMPMGGIVTGILARFALSRFRPKDSMPARTQRDRR